MTDKIFSKITNPFNVKLELHEIETAEFLKELGKDIEFIPPNYTKGARTPDIKMDDVLWEIKSPRGNSARTIENNYRLAEKQSENIIFDLRRIALNEKQAIAQIKRNFELSRRKSKRILIITKQRTLIDLQR